MPPPRPGHRALHRIRSDSSDSSRVPICVSQTFAVPGLLMLIPGYGVRSDAIVLTATLPPSPASSACAVTTTDEPLASVIASRIRKDVVDCVDAASRDPAGCAKADPLLFVIVAVPRAKIAGLRVSW